MSASIGADGTVRVFDYLTKRTLVTKKYKSGGSYILWPGRSVDSKMGTLVGGFSDGVVRVMGLELGEQESPDDFKIVLLHAMKPHKGEVTAMIIDDDGKKSSNHQSNQKSSMDLELSEKLNSSVLKYSQSSHYLQKFDQNSLSRKDPRDGIWGRLYSLLLRYLLQLHAHWVHQGRGSCYQHGVV